MKVYVIAKCVGCGERRKIYEGDIPKGEQPMCDKCFMPMIPVKAIARQERKP